MEQWKSFKGRCMFLFKRCILSTRSFLFLDQDASEVHAVFIFYNVVHNLHCLNFRSYFQGCLGE